jgi:hypothetical protein
MEKQRPRVWKTESNYCVDPLRWQPHNLYLQKLALTLPTSGGRSVVIARLRTKATEFNFQGYQHNSLRNPAIKILE